MVFPSEVSYDIYEVVFTYCLVPGLDDIVVHRIATFVFDSIGYPPALVIQVTWLQVLTIAVDDYVWVVKVPNGCRQRRMYYSFFTPTPVLLFVLM